MSAICVTTGAVAVAVTVLFFWHPPKPKTSAAAHTQATPKHPFILIILILHNIKLLTTLTGWYSPKTGQILLVPQPCLKQNAVLL
jgi:hypothetical protein